MTQGCIVKVVTLFLNSCGTDITFTASTQIESNRVQDPPNTPQALCLALGTGGKCAPQSGGQVSDLFHPLLSNQKCGGLGNCPPRVSPIYYNLLKCESPEIRQAVPWSIWLTQARGNFLTEASTLPWDPIEILRRQIDRECP